MSADLVARLRYMADQHERKLWVDPVKVLREAADELERLAERVNAQALALSDALAALEAAHPGVLEAKDE